MKRKLLILSLLIFAFIGVKSQTTTATYNTLYQTQNQSLWQAGTAGIFNIYQPFFDFNWNEGGSFGDIYSIAGQSFGAEVDAQTWGEIGSGLTINFGTEQVDINYNSNMELNYPSLHTFQAGDQVIIDTDWEPLNSGSSILPSAYDMNIALILRIGMNVELGAEMCAFGCTDFDIINMHMNPLDIELIKLSSATGLSLMNDLVNIPPSAGYPLNFFPVIYSDPTGIMTLNLDMPHNTGGASSSYLSNEVLKYSSTYHYFNMHLSIPKMIGAMHIPYVSAFFGNLSNSWTTGAFYLNYTIMEAGFDLGLYNNQRLSFDPEMHGKLDFPGIVDYEIINPLNGAVVESGVDSVINYQPGQEIRFVFPCQYDFMDVTPSYNMTNEFTNHTYDSIAFDFVFDMLAFNVGVQAMTVIPEICIPIYRPCGPWYCPVCDWCHSGDLCTPAVNFDGFNAGFGPLVHWQPNLYNTSYDWVDNSWEMAGFNSFDDLTPIRIEPAKFSVTTTNTNVLCHGDNTAEASAFVTNAASPYTYEWSTGESSFSHQTSHSVEDLAAGTHYVSVTDANGCMVFASFIVEEPEAPLAIQGEITHLTCNQSNDGEINIVTTGGTTPYSFLWSNGDTNESISNLEAAAYNLTVQDANGCTAIESFMVTEPDALSLELVTNNVNCSGEASGNIQAIVNGGIPPYSYNWSNSETEEEITNLPAGTYSLTVSDANGCTIESSSEIQEPSNPLNVSASSEDVLCHGEASGSINLTVEGGTPPYNYAWYDNDNTWLNHNSNLLENIVAGTYEIIVTDANACEFNLEVTINEPEAFNISADIVDVLCYGESTGSITITTSGATPPFNYIWSNGATTENIENIPAGAYTVTLTDQNGCIYEFNGNVEQPEEPLMSTIQTTSVGCYGESTGSIEVISEGGTSPYTYLWSDSSTESSIDNVPAGIYSVTVTDSHGCEHYTGGEVREPDAPLSLNSNLTDVSCYNGENGSITLNIEGGTLPYHISWDDNEYLIHNNLYELNQLVSGQYNIAILDANNCKLNDSFFINEPEDVSISISTEMVSCFGGNDGYAIAEVVGGTSPYSYLWSNGHNSEENTLLTAGHYTLTVTDAQDCQYQSETDINSWPEIEIEYTVYEMTCQDIDDASIQVEVTGGTESFDYVWSNGAVTKDIQDLAEGSYTLTITDGNQCEEILEIYVAQSTQECLNIPNSFTPNGDSYNDTWVLRNIEAYPDALVQVFDQAGRIVFESNGAYQAWDGTFNGNPMPASVYYYIVDLKNGEEVRTGSLTLLR